MAMAGFGGVSLVTGTESFLVERAVAQLVAQARATMADASVTTVQAVDLTPAAIDQLAGADLFSSAVVACVLSAEKTPKTAETQLLGLARSVPDTVALIVTHAGDRAKPLLTALTVLAATTVDCPPLKSGQLPAFVAAEARSAGKTMDGPASRQLIDAIGNDPRGLAAAVAQLAADAPSDRIGPALVATYFAGQASVTAYLVSDNALAGRVGQAIVQLRWALATGAAHTQVTNALAAGLRQVGLYLWAAATHRPTADEIGAPKWKLDSIAGVARAWSDRSVAAAIRAVAEADAQIKGAAQDADFALERLVLRLASLRRASSATPGPS